MTSRTPSHPDSGAHCASRLKVLADPTRLDVVQELMHGPRHVSELNEVIQIEQSLLSHHLRVLRDADVITAERDGKAVLYRLAPDVSLRPERKAISLGCCTIDFDEAGGDEEERA